MRSPGRIAPVFVSSSTRRPTGTAPPPSSSKTAGSPLSREDAWQRATEFLFERLAVRWTVAGLPIERQSELLGRYRMASQEERAWVRGVMREHVAEHFPELQPP